MQLGAARLREAQDGAQLVEELQVRGRALRRAAEHRFHALPAKHLDAPILGPNLHTGAASLGSAWTALLCRQSLSLGAHRKEALQGVIAQAVCGLRKARVPKPLEVERCSCAANLAGLHVCSLSL